MKVLKSNSLRNALAKDIFYCPSNKIYRDTDGKYLSENDNRASENYALMPPSELYYIPKYDAKNFRFGFTLYVFRCIFFSVSGKVIFLTPKFDRQKKKKNFEIQLQEEAFLRYIYT